MASAVGGIRARRSPRSWMRLWAIASSSSTRILLSFISMRCLCVGWGPIDAPSCPIHQHAREHGLVRAQWKQRAPSEAARLSKFSTRQQRRLRVLRAGSTDTSEPRPPVTLNARLTCASDRIESKSATSAVSIDRLYCACTARRLLRTPLRSAAPVVRSTWQRGRATDALKLPLCICLCDNIVTRLRRFAIGCSHPASVHVL